MCSSGSFCSWFATASNELVGEDSLFFFLPLELLEGNREDRFPPVLEKVSAAEAADKESRAIPAIR